MNNIKEQNKIKFFKEITMEELEEKGFLSRIGITNWKNECVGAIYKIKYQEGEVKRNHTF